MVKLLKGMGVALLVLTYLCGAGLAEERNVAPVVIDPDQRAYTVVVGEDPLELNFKAIDINGDCLRATTDLNAQKAKWEMLTLLERIEREPLYTIPEIPYGPENLYLIYDANPEPERKLVQKLWVSENGSRIIKTVKDAQDHVQGMLGEMEYEPMGPPPGAIPGPDPRVPLPQKCKIIDYWVPEHMLLPGQDLSLDSAVGLFHIGHSDLDIMYDTPTYWAANMIATTKYGDLTPTPSYYRVGKQFDDSGRLTVEYMEKFRDGIDGLLMEIEATDNRYFDDYGYVIEGTKMKECFQGEVTSSRYSEHMINELSEDLEGNIVHQDITRTTTLPQESGSGPYPPLPGLRPKYVELAKIENLNIDPRGFAHETVEKTFLPPPPVTTQDPNPQPVLLTELRLSDRVFDHYGNPLEQTKLLKNNPKFDELGNVISWNEVSKSREHSIVTLEGSGKAKRYITHEVIDFVDAQRNVIYTREIENIWYKPTEDRAQIITTRARDGSYNEYTESIGNFCFDTFDRIMSYEGTITDHLTGETERYVVELRDYVMEVDSITTTWYSDEFRPEPQRMETEYNIVYDKPGRIVSEDVSITHFGEWGITETEEYHRIRNEAFDSLDNITRQIIRIYKDPDFHEPTEIHEIDSKYEGYLLTSRIITKKIIDPWTYEVVSETTTPDDINRPILVHKAEDHIMRSIMPHVPEKYVKDASYTIGALPANIAEFQLKWKPAAEDVGEYPNTALEVTDGKEQSYDRAYVDITVEMGPEVDITIPTDLITEVHVTGKAGFAGTLKDVDGEIASVICSAYYFGQQGRVLLARSTSHDKRGDNPPVRLARVRDTWYWDWLLVLGRFDQLRPRMFVQLQVEAYDDDGHKISNNCTTLGAQFANSKFLKLTGLEVSITDPSGMFTHIDRKETLTFGGTLTTNSSTKKIKQVQCTAYHLKHTDNGWKWVNIYSVNSTDKHLWAVRVPDINTPGVKSWHCDISAAFLGLSVKPGQWVQLQVTAQDEDGNEITNNCTTLGGRFINSKFVRFKN